LASALDEQVDWLFEVADRAVVRGGASMVESNNPAEVLRGQVLESAHRVRGEVVYAGDFGGGVELLHPVVRPGDVRVLGVVNEKALCHWRNQ
jgi:hypothetical protein